MYNNPMNGIRYGLLSLFLVFPFVSPKAQETPDWPEGVIEAPKQDFIGPSQTLVGGRWREDTTEALCRSEIPAAPGPERGHWIKRCYVYTHWVRESDPKFVESVSLRSTGIDKWDGYDAESLNGIRTFDLIMDGRARQGLYIDLWDRPDNYISHILSSTIYVFPRDVVSAVRLLPGSVTEVTIPTGEKVRFNSNSRKIISGAFKEGKFVDRNSDVNKRKFADVDYVGAGLAIRVNARGADPRLWNSAQKNWAVLQKWQSVNGKRVKKTCRLHPKQLWNQHPNSQVEFLYATDDSFAEFLKTAKDAVSGAACGINF